MQTAKDPFSPDALNKMSRLVEQRDLLNTMQQKAQLQQMANPYLQASQLQQMVNAHNGQIAQIYGVGHVQSQFWDGAIPCQQCGQHQETIRKLNEQVQALTRQVHTLATSKDTEKGSHENPYLLGNSMVPSTK